MAKCWLYLVQHAAEKYLAVSRLFAKYEDKQVTGVKSVEDIHACGPQQR